MFQPHLFTRTRDFTDGFAESLNNADEVILLPIYPAREKPIEGVESEMLATKMTESKVLCCSKNDLLQLIKKIKDNMEIELLIIAGAGDIDTMVLPIKEIMM